MLFDGVFHAAHEVYGLTFAERPDLDGYHPDVRVFEVFDADGSGLGLSSPTSTRAPPSAAAPG